MRYMAVDLGAKRTGIAVGEAVTGIVSPVAVLQVPMAEGDGEKLLGAIAAASVEHLGEVGRGRGEIVVGLPLNMDGTEGGGAKQAREFGARIAERTKRVVHFVDERLSSAQAEWELAGSGLTHGQKKERRDALAAAAVLREFLASRGAG
jgi:putative Holliday junction resolvase